MQRTFYKKSRVTPFPETSPGYPHNVLRQKMWQENEGATKKELCKFAMPAKGSGVERHEQLASYDTRNRTTNYMGQDSLRRRTRSRGI